jgi:hypothetical protein
LGPAIFRARLVIAPPLFVVPPTLVFVYHASPKSLYWAMRAHRRCKMQGLGPGNGENNLEWNVKILSMGIRVHFPKFGQLLTKRRTKCAKDGCKTRSTLLFLRMIGASSDSTGYQNRPACRLIPMIRQSRRLLKALSLAWRRNPKGAP